MHDDHENWDLKLANANPFAPDPWNQIGALDKRLIDERQADMRAFEKRQKDIENQITISIGGSASNGLGGLAFPFYLVLIIGGFAGTRELHDWTGSWWTVGFIGAVALALMTGLYKFFETLLAYSTDACHRFT